MKPFSFPDQTAIFREQVRVGVAGGVAGPLDGSGKIPSSQIDLSSLTDLLLGHVIDATAYGMATANADNSDEFEAACAAAVAADWTLLVPPGTYNFSATTFVDFAGRLRILSFGGTTFNITANLTIRGTASTATTLAADLAAGDIILTPTDITDFENGDIIHIDTDTVVETGWGYHKQLMREVTFVNEDDTIVLNEGVFFPFTTAESTKVNLYKRAECSFKGISTTSATTKHISFERLARLEVCDGIDTGPARKWLTSDYADGLTVTRCMNVHIYNRHQQFMRYSPFLFCCWNVLFENSWVYAIRHADANTYCEHVRLRNIVPRDTDNILQCHPSIDFGCEDINYVATSADNSGIDLRSLGAFIDRCSSETIAGVLENTNNLVGLNSTYVEIARKTQRRISDFRSNTSVIAPGDEGVFTVERSRVPRIGGGPTDAVVYIDERTTYTQEIDPSRADAFLRTIPPARHVAIPPVDGYVTSGSPLAITGVTLDANGGLSVSGSAPSDGSIIYVNGMVGSTEGNDRYFKTANASGSDFDILDPDTDEAIDTSGWTPWTSAGKATVQVILDTYDARSVPCLGLNGTMKFKMRVLTDVHTATSYGDSIKVRFLQGGNIDQNVAVEGYVTIIVTTFGGSVRHKYHFNASYYNSSLPQLYVLDMGSDTVESSPGAGAVTGALTLTKHFRAELVAEGVPSLDAITAPGNHRYYIKVDWAAVVPSATKHTTVDIEWEVQRAA